MSLLQVCLFGNVQVIHIDRPAQMKLTRIVQALLSYLLLHRQRLHPREVLTGLFWGDHNEDRARGCLNTALWRLRQALEPPGIHKGTYLFTSPTGEVGFNRESDYWLDVAVFEERVGRLLTKGIQTWSTSDAQELQNTLELYSSDLLESFYDDWALRERERLRSLYIKSLIQLMNYQQAIEAYEESLAYGRRILYLEPLREEIHRQVMRLYLASGQRALALRQYQICRKILSEDLGVSPMEETQALYRQVLQEASSADREPGPGKVESIMPASNGINLENVLTEIRAATRNFNQIQRKLKKATQLLEEHLQK